jgi:hypothetical protein
MNAGLIKYVSIASFHIFSKSSFYDKPTIRSSTMYATEYVFLNYSNSMELSPSSEAASRKATQEFPNIL